MSVEDVDRGLAAAIGKLGEASEKIMSAAAAWSENRDVLEEIFAGSVDPDARDAHRTQTAAVEQLDEVAALLTAVREQIEDYRHSIGATSPSNTSPVPNPVPKHPPEIVGVDGARYPPGAAWAVPELPSRVRSNGGQTVAKIKIGDRQLPGEFRSGTHDLWTGEATQRLKALGVGVPSYLAHHVEIRAAAMLIRAGVKSATIAINHVPCGYQTPPPGCHQLLEAFLPEGSEMTVQGTDRKGRSYQRTYQGKAKR